jgi:hypothetical protein
MKRELEPTQSDSGPAKQPIVPGTPLYQLLRLVAQRIARDEAINPRETKRRAQADDSANARERTSTAGINDEIDSSS